MAEYIEREAALKLLEVEERCGYLDAGDILSIPAADVVEAIRCPACAFSFGLTDQDGRRQLCCTEIGKRGLRDDDYCSFGKRRKQHEDQKT